MTAHKKTKLRTESLMRKKCFEDQQQRQQLRPKKSDVYLNKQFYFKTDAGWLHLFQRNFHCIQSIWRVDRRHTRDADIHTEIGVLLIFSTNIYGISYEFHPAQQHITLAQLLLIQTAFKIDRIVGNILIALLHSTHTQTVFTGFNCKRASALPQSSIVLIPLFPPICVFLFVVQL